MSVQRVVLLASALAALVAFAAPLASQAHYTWSSPGTLVLAGSLATNVEGSAVTNGPCEVEFEVEVFNGAEAGEGEVTGGEVATPCDVQPFADPECHLTEVHLGNLPWRVTTSTTHPQEIDIHSLRLTNTYSTKCQELGLPKEISAGGTLTATFHTNGQCITFTNSGDLLVLVPAVSLRVNGSTCYVLGPTLH